MNPKPAAKIKNENAIRALVSILLVTSLIPNITISSIQPNSIKAYAKSIKAESGKNSKRKRTTIDFGNAADQLYYQDEDGNFKSIDTTLVTSTDPNYDYMNEKNHFKTYFCADPFDSKDNIKFQVGNASIAFKTVTNIKIESRDIQGNEVLSKNLSIDDLKPIQEQDRNSKKGKKVAEQKNKIRYPRIYEGQAGHIDADYTIDSSGLLEEFVLDRHQGFPEISQEITLTNAYLKEENGAINFYHKESNKILWVVPKPLMYEAGNRDEKSYGLHFEIEKLSADRYLITKVLDSEGKSWLESPERTYPLVIDQTISYGSEYEFETGQTEYVSVAKLDSTHFVVAYSDAGDSGRGKAVIGTVSGSAISYGLAYTFCTNNTWYISVDALDSTHFVVAYSDRGDSNRGKAKIGTVIGSTIAYGIAYQFESGQTKFISVSALDTSKFTIAYADTDENSYGKTLVGTNSASIISYGSIYSFNSGQTEYISVSALDSTHVVISYEDLGNSNYGTAIIGTISGSNISYGSEHVFNTRTTYYTTVSALDATHFVVAYQDTTGSGQGTAIIGAVSGPSVSYGAEYIFNSGATNYVAISNLDSTHFIITYEDAGNSSYGTAVAGIASGSTIFFGSEYTFNSGTTYFTSVSALDPTHFTVTYEDSGNANHGTAIIGTVTYSSIITQQSYRFQNDDGTTVNNNSNQANADTARTEVKKGERINIRIQIDNTGSCSTGNKIYKLQYDKNDNNWTDVGSSAEIQPSLGFSGSNGDSITSSVCSSNSGTWASGAWYEDTASTGNIDLDINYYTELCFMVQTGNATLNTTYRFRLYNTTDSLVLDDYTVYPTLSIVNSTNDISNYSKGTLNPLWWNDSWPYKKAIAIDNTSNSNNLTNYQVLAIVDTASLISDGKMQTNCNDIRFVDSDNISELSYWIESGANTASTKIWVKVPSVPASSSKNIYMYYGNDSASAASSIDNTMDVGLRYFYYNGTSFNTFQGTDVDTSINWNWGLGTVSINGNAWEDQIDTVSIRWEGWIKNKGSGNHTFYVTTNDGSRLYVPNTNLIINQWSDKLITTEYSGSYSFSSPVSIKYEWYDNLLSAAAQLGWAPADGSGKVYPIPSSYLRSRKYASPEPSTSIGTEEMAQADLTYYLDSKGYSDVASDDSNRDPITSSSNYPVFIFKQKNFNSIDQITINWDGQSTVSTATSPVYLDLYNYRTSSWINIASNNSTAANTDFNMVYDLKLGTNDYYDSNNWIAVRVYQASGTETLKTDYLSITFSPQNVSFSIEGVAVDQTLEGITTDIDLAGSPYILNFGALPIGNNPLEAASKLTVSCNSTNGYTITVQQDRDLTSDSNIVSPVSSTNAFPANWPVLVPEGAFGYHTSDESLGTGTQDRFALNDTYARFETTPYEIAYNPSSVTNETTYLVYRIQVGYLQLPGIYSNKITYICTGIF